jgi:hypothetical protein
LRRLGFDIFFLQFNDFEFFILKYFYQLFLFKFEQLRCGARHLPRGCEQHLSRPSD